MDARQSRSALALSTLAFALSFAVWGMIAPMAKTFKDEFGFSETQKWLLTAAPVLLGSIIRLPMGMLTDRFGGRIVFSLLMLFVALPAFMLSQAHAYTDLLLWGVLLGMAGTSFAVGVGFTSKWFPPEKQGLALGIYGAGNIGQSIALFGVPALSAMLAAKEGWRQTYQLFALVILVYGAVFLLLARNAPVQAKPKPFSAMLKVLVEQPLSWLLSLFYFVTFGGFVALSISLPNLLQDKTLFNLTPADAGLRVAGLVVVATLARPFGGWLSDRMGGARLLVYVFAGAGLLALGMTFRHIVPFTIGALGVAAFIGLGNGAVFKLVPQYFPKDTGTVTGLVGAMGGLGGFFPPLVLGLIKSNTGSYALGFVFLSVFCFGCLALNAMVLLRQPGRSHSGPDADMSVSR